MSKPSMSKKKRAPQANRSRGKGAADRTSKSRESLEDLLRHTRRELIEYARGVGLTGLARLTKGALATRYLQELERIGGPVLERPRTSAPRASRRSRRPAAA